MLPEQEIQSQMPECKPLRQGLVPSKAVTATLIERVAKQQVFCGCMSPMGWKQKADGGIQFPPLLVCLRAENCNGKKPKKTRAENSKTSTGTGASLERLRSNDKEQPTS